MMDCPFMSPNDSLSIFSVQDSDHVKPSNASSIIEPDDRGRQILIMNVDIGDGRADEIVVHEVDEPEELARAFCLKYKLSPQIQQALSYQIESNIEQLVDEQCTYVDESPKKQQQIFDTPTKKPQEPSFYQKAFNELRATLPLTSGSSTDRPKTSKPKVRKLDVFAGLPGHRLYMKGMLMKKALEKGVEKRKKEKAVQEVAGLTFSPKILKWTMSEGYHSERNLATVTNRLKTKELKLKKMRQDLEFKELIDCTFKPEICEASRELMQSRGGTAAERFEELYSAAKELDKKRRFAELESIRNTCPFKPEIHESPLKSSRSANFTPIRHRPKVPVLPLTEQEIDPECSFTPRTGRAPKHSRNTEALPIGLYLHTQKLKRTHPEKQKQPAKLSHISSEASLKIVDKLRSNRYEQIFNVFYRAGNDEVVWDISRLEGYDSKLAKVIAPLIAELAESSESYDFPKFCELMEKFALKLPPIDKGILYNTTRATPPPERPSFKPKITEFSSPNLKSRSTLSLYDRLLKDQQRTQSKLNETKTKQIEKELDECTFYPNTIELRNTLKAKITGVAGESIKI